MKHQKLWFGLSAGIVLSWVAGCATASVAVEPAPISHDDQVEWSTVVRDRFDGDVVYDKHFAVGKFMVVSSWSTQAIRATYTQFYSEIIGYHTVSRSQWVTHGKKRHRVDYPEREPIYRRYAKSQSPTAIKFSINDQIYTYTDGPVAPDLAVALASAPPQNMTIRLIWTYGSSMDMEIGRGTVAAWKTIFAGIKPNPVDPPSVSTPLTPLVVQMNRQGQVFVDSRSVSTVMLTEQIQQYLQQYPQGTVVLKADPHATYEQVTQTLDLLRSLAGDRAQLAVD